MTTLRSLAALLPAFALSALAAGCSAESNVASGDDDYTSGGEKHYATDVTYEFCAGEPQPHQESGNMGELTDMPGTMECLVGDKLGNVVSLEELDSERGAWIILRRRDPKDKADYMADVAGQKIMLLDGEPVSKLRLDPSIGNVNGKPRTEMGQLLIERGYLKRGSVSDWQSTERTFFAVTPDNFRVKALQECFTDPNDDGSCPEIGVEGKPAEMWLRVTMRADLEIKDIEETGAIGRPRTVLFENPYRPSEVTGYSRRSRDNVVTSKWLHFVTSEWDSGVSLRIHYWNDEGEELSSESLWHPLTPGGAGGG